MKTIEELTEQLKAVTGIVEFEHLAKDLKASGCGLLTRKAKRNCGRRWACPDMAHDTGFGKRINIMIDDAETNSQCRYVNLNLVFEVCKCEPELVNFSSKD